MLACDSRPCLCYPSLPAVVGHNCLAAEVGLAAQFFANIKCTGRQFGNFYSFFLSFQAPHLSSTSTVKIKNVFYRCLGFVGAGGLMRGSSLVAQACTRRVYPAAAAVAEHHRFMHAAEQTLSTSKAVVVVCFFRSPQNPFSFRLFRQRFHLAKRKTKIKRNVVVSSEWI